MADWQGVRVHGSAGTSSSSSRDIVSPLALKLQQVWLQTQIRSSSKDFSSVADSAVSSSSVQQPSSSSITSPVAVTAGTPSSSSESGDDSWGCGGAEFGSRNQHGIGEDEDAVLQFIDNMLMEDQIEQQACLDLEMGVGAFQAELAELIQSPSEVSSSTTVPCTLVQYPRNFCSPRPGEFDIVQQGFHSEPARQQQNHKKQSPPGSKKRTLMAASESEEEKQVKSDFFEMINRVGFFERQNLFGLELNGLSKPKNGLSLGKPPIRPPRLLIQRNEQTSLWEQMGLESSILDKLLICGEAVSTGDYSTAWGIVEELRAQAGPDGTASQRVVHYFLHGLIARMSHTGEKLFSVMCKSRPSIAETLKAVQMILKQTPFLGLPHFFTNKIILEAIHGERKVHIVDFGIMYGLQWPALFQLLAERKEGAPQLRITGIDLPPKVINHSGRIRETGSRLKRCAAAWGIPFKFHSRSCPWESVEASTLQLKEDEVLIINCSFKQTNLFDESVIAESPKYLWLTKIRNLNPRVFIQSLASSPFGGPIFMTRFQAALVHHAAIFAAMDACISRMLPDRRVIEQDKYGREIMNIVACEGVDRVERSESHQQWHARAVKAGLEILPLSETLFEESKSFARNYNRDLTVDKNGDWMWLGWKRQIIHAYSSWRVAS